MPGIEYEVNRELQQDRKRQEKNVQTQGFPTPKTQTDFTEKLKKTDFTFTEKLKKTDTMTLSRDSTADTEVPCSPEWTTPPPSSPVGTGGVSSRAIEVPIGRSLELNQEIQRHDAAFAKKRDHLHILEEQINSRGGDMYAPPPLVSERDGVKKEIKRLEQTVTALSAERRLQYRYEVELCAFALLRGELSIIKGHEPICSDVSALLDRIYPDIFDEKRILLGLLPANLTSKFKEAKAVDEEIAQLQEIAFVHPKTKLLRQRLQSLQATKQEEKTSRDYPAPATLLPQSSSDVDLPRLFDDASPSNDLRFDEGWHLRISVFRMPRMDKTEEETEETIDAIVFREIYGNADDTMQMVRIALIYYNPWRLGRFSLSENPEMTGNLSRLRSRLCRLCKKSLRKETSRYRLPSCILFLRFYDETEQLEDRLQPTLLHIPFCRALDSGAWTDDSENILSETGKLYNCSIPDWMFGELFKRQMTGSNWLERKDLPEAIYKILREDVPEQVRFLIHSQIYKLGEKNGSTGDSRRGFEASG